MAQGPGAAAKLEGQYDPVQQHQGQTAKDQDIDQDQNGDDQPMPDIPGL
jgi:hypothetical protein